MKYDIKPNPNNGGENCIFEHKGSWYYADRVDLDNMPMMPGGLNLGIETMIFPFDKEKGDVMDYHDLYCDKTGKSLEECIDEFIQELNEQ